ncbi:MAG TPA: hydrogenase nickel incorporation protein HypB [Acetobacteraceae bacterium]|nr:hydrogenase nickel incorporation protein HypB [Acetobacteraceae bacterium]
MCDSCGCATGGTQVVVGGHRIVPPRDDDAAVLTRLLAENDGIALHNREHIEDHGVLAINLMSSPGAGKTALLEATIEALHREFRFGVIEGDLETDNDAVRIRRHHVPVVQITTGNACHLDAGMVHEALHELPLDKLDILFIENVGNLVCPAAFALGQHRNVTLLSATEGDDKPAKYPVMFRTSHLVLISKADLLPHLDDFDPARATEAVRRLANDAPVFTLSARRHTGMAPWADWLRSERLLLRSRLELAAAD